MFHSGSREATVRNPGNKIAYWIPDLGFASSGMTILRFSDFPATYRCLFRLAIASLHRVAVSPGLRVAAYNVRKVICGIEIAN